MPWEFVEEKCNLLGTEQAQVTISGDSYDDLLTPEVKKAAMSKGAELGLGSCGITRMEGPYFPTASGGPIETAEDMKQFRQSVVMNNGKPPRPVNVFILQRSGIRI